VGGVKKKDQNSQDCVTLSLLGEGKRGAKKWSLVNNFFLLVSKTVAAKKGRGTG